MISVANLLDMEEEIDRRSFVRRVFAMGAGIAASGALVRALVPARVLWTAELWAPVIPHSQDSFCAVGYWTLTVDARGDMHSRPPGVAVPREEAAVGYLSVDTSESGMIRWHEAP